MKHLITILAILISSVCFAQRVVTETKVKGDFTIEYTFEVIKPNPFVKDTVKYPATIRVYKRSGTGRLQSVELKGMYCPECKNEDQLWIDKAKSQ